MSQSHIDPDADPSRRAWLACPNCDHGAGCAECHSRRNCGTHWQYLLKNSASRVFLQCPTCLCVWTVDTAKLDRGSPTLVRGRTRHGAATPHPAGEGEHEPDDAVIGRVWVGESPSDIVISPSGEFVYVMTADSVRAINRLHHIVAAIPIGAEPKRMMMSSDGRRIYVTAYDGELSIIDPVAMTSKTFAKPRSTTASVSPDGDYIYLAHEDALGAAGSGGVSAIRADGIAVAFNAIEGFITGMALSPNGRWLYVASTPRGEEARCGTITVLDTAGHKTVDVIAVDEGPESITVDAGGLLYVAHFHTNSVSVIDPATHRAVSVGLDDAPMEVVARPDTGFAYTANSHSVTVIDSTTATTASVMVGELPRRLNISPDGRRLYATDFANGSVWALDTSDNSVVAAVQVCAHPAAAKLSPDGELLYVTDSRDGMLTVLSTTLLNPGSPNTR